MKSKNKLILVMICMVALFSIFVFRILYKPDNGSGELTTIERENESAEEAGITRATAAKMISLLANSHDEIEKRDRQITYSDTIESKWYDKYINNLVQLGILWNSGDAAIFGAQDFVTYAQCKEMLRVLRGEEYINQSLSDMSYVLSEKADAEPITLPEWLELYRKLMSDGVNEGVVEKDLYILEIKETSEEVPSWKTVTNNGEYYFDGFALDNLKDCSIKTFIKGEDILFINGISDQEVLLKNVWIQKAEGKEMKAFLNGCTKTFTIRNPLSEPIEQVIGDLVVQNQSITGISIKPERINDKVLLTDESQIELENHGKIPLDEDFKIYRIYGDVASEILNGILVGYKTTDFVIADGKINAALVTGEATADSIRVAIKTDGFADYYHASVRLTANVPFTAIYGNKQKNYEAGKEVDLKPDSKMMKRGRVRIQLSDPSGRISLLSVSRNGGAPAYRGSIEVSAAGTALLIINELSMEEYLYAVIPSEMPTSYGVEALKVQAVCARSYSYMQVMSNGLKNLGAHVDDSVSYQVYNNTPENDLSIQAVQETKGKVLLFNNKAVTAYYFSTSCGHTSGAEEVWLSSKAVPYLKGSLQVEEGTEISFEADLSVEANFRNFILNNPCETYDSGFAWYRWNIQIPARNLRKSIEASVSKRYQVNPVLIQTKQEDGTYKSQPVESIGELQDIQIQERKTGGIVTSVILVGSERTVRVRSEYNIRALLAPIDSIITRHDGSKVNGLSMLPSSFFIIDKKGREFTFTGGGYGHGVGMSQNGVKALVDRGKNYEEILSHYYKDVTIGVLY